MKQLAVLSSNSLLHNRSMDQPKNKLIVALDVDSTAHARRLVEELCDVVGMFKVGSQLFTAAGPGLVREIVQGGGQVFLDLKFHDIPNTVAAAGVEAARLGVSIFNVHAMGGTEMMRRTADAVSETAQQEGFLCPSIIAVTLLTSANEATLSELGINSDPAKHVVHLAQMAQASGLDGVVASPKEAAAVRSRVTKTGFLIVTPGIRPSGAATDDQKRVTTPREAILAGADYIVVGRPIVNAPNPVRAAAQIVDDLAFRKGIA
jgi:orotidine-5'-phosphate decarboxylase